MPNLRKVLGTVKAEVEAHNQVTATEATREKKHIKDDANHASSASARIIAENNSTAPPMAMACATRSRRRVPQRLQRMNILIGAAKPKAQRAYSTIPMEDWNLDSYEPTASGPVHPVAWDYGKVTEFSMALPVPSDKDDCTEHTSHDYDDNAITTVECNGVPVGPLAQKILKSALSAGLITEPEEEGGVVITTHIVHSPSPKQEFRNQPADQVGHRERSGWMHRAYQMLRHPWSMLRWRGTCSKE